MRRGVERSRRAIDGCSGRRRRVDRHGKEVPARRRPAALVTGDTAPERILESTEAGYPVLHKPLDPQLAIAALQQAITGGRHAANALTGPT